MKENFMSDFSRDTLSEICESLAFRCTYSDYKNYKKGSILYIQDIEDLAKSGKTWTTDVMVDENHISIVRTGIKEDEGKSVLVECDILYSGLLEKIDSELEFTLGLGLI